jgi:hypothetical protein
MLTDRQTMQITSLGILMIRANGLMDEVLSPFERDLVRDVAGRYVRDRAAAVITQAEWVVVGEVIDCLRATLAAQITAAGAADQAA